MTDAVSRYLKNVFEERDGPTDEYDAEESGFLENVPLFQLKVAVPRKRHKEIGNHKQKDGKQAPGYHFLMRSLIRSAADFLLSGFLGGEMLKGVKLNPEKMTSNDLRLAGSIALNNQTFKHTFSATG